jgi:hypothetical protein
MGGRVFLGLGCLNNFFEGLCLPTGQEGSPLMTRVRTLWVDEAGFIVSAELVLVATILVISMVVGLVCIRNQVVQELIDVGQAIGSICQTYAYTGIETPCDHRYGYVSGSYYLDVRDYCQPDHGQRPGEPAGGIMFTRLPDASLTGENWH